MIKKIFICSVALIFLLFIFYFFEKLIRCENNGLKREDAIKIAANSLNYNFEAISFVLEKEQFQNYDKLWLFTYRKNDCVVTISVDKCGVSDIGGITKNCEIFQK